LKNIAGHNISIFLYRFELRGYGIDFVLNEAIAEDMYPDINAKMKPLIHTCCVTLLRYKHFSVSNTIMDGSFLVTGEFEVMLSKGLGLHFVHDEKMRLFQDAKSIADLLSEVMDRGTQEMKKGIQRKLPPLNNHQLKAGGLLIGGLNRRLEEKTTESRWFLTTSYRTFVRAKAALMENKAYAKFQADKKRA
jgi:hypothetical protein